jgi:hypothetical protein
MIEGRLGYRVREGSSGKVVVVPALTDSRETARLVDRVEVEHSVIRDESFVLAVSGLSYGLQSVVPGSLRALLVRVSHPIFSSQDGGAGVFEFV